MIPQDVGLCTMVPVLQKTEGAEEERVGAGEDPGRKEPGDLIGLSEPFPDQLVPSLGGSHQCLAPLRTRGAQQTRGHEGRMGGGNPLSVFPLHLCASLTTFPG